MTYEEKAVSETIAALLSDHPDLDPAAAGSLDSLDQFHIGGAAAVDLLIPALGLTDGAAVLDIGSGFGGPARQIARRTGNRVVGIDITPDYVEAARDLTAMTGLSGLVEFETADVATFEPQTRFQAAITMHVQMSVQDKVTWFGHIARRLAPGGRLAVWEVCQPAPGGELPWPMPWSLDGSDSYVVSAESLRTSIESAGFTTTEWTPRSAWVQDWISRAFANGLPSGPTLQMLLDDGQTRVINFAGAIGNGSVEVWQGSFTKNAG